MIAGGLEWMMKYVWKMSSQAPRRRLRRSNRRSRRGAPTMLGLSCLRAVYFKSGKAPRRERDLSHMMSFHLLKDCD